MNNDQNNSFSSLFNASSTQANGGNQLEKTAQLTSVSMSIANEIVKLLDTDDSYKPMVTASINDHNTMDKLIETVYPLTGVDVSFLKNESQDVLDKMIRSQQSKRSRSKSKTMTIDNYKTMLTGAVAENLLRIASNKPKSSGGGSRSTSEIGYSEDELKAFAADQESLKKELRNIQSKKSITKSKIGFDENSDRWQQLLAAEEKLKGLRIGSVTVVTPEAKKAIENRDEIKNLFAAAGAELDQMKGADAKQLLKNIQDMLSK